MSETVQLSPQQQAVMDFVSKTGNGNLMIVAVAGSGKTFTLLELSKLLVGDVAFMAFSKNISVEIEDKVDKIRHILRCNMNVGTVHAFGARALRKVFPKYQIMKRQEKCERLMEIVRNEKTGETGVPIQLRNFVIKAYRFARQWGVGVLPEFPFSSREKWLELVDHFDLEEELIEDEEAIPDNLDEMVREAINWTYFVIKLGVTREICAQWIDFEDMIYLPLYLKLRMRQFDNTLVDECQDLNPTRIEFAHRITKPSGRAIFVGDPHQAIFGFTGADSESVNKIKAKFNATVLPLTYSFRCPQSVVQFVRQWVSHIEAHPDAPVGFAPPMEGATITGAEMMLKGLTPDDAILCRNNAPLVELFFSFLAKGIPCHIEGKDEVGAAIIRLVNKFPKVKSLNTLRNKLEAYKEKEVAKLVKKGKEDKADRLADIVAAIFAIMSALPTTANVADLNNKVDEMFADTPEGKPPKNLTLTTSHKAKGREWKRVFWYGRNRWNPSPYAHQPWQMEQEINLMYVAGTRAKSELYDVTVPVPVYNNRRAA